ncbi:hypothetical protein EKD04_018225 [Chloroflexales bacterium ZM16-3]|nr:hypothetical protein [Chloroflexales bacterium ZM16-3]
MSTSRSLRLQDSLQLLHGDSPTPITLALIYGLGLSAGGALALLGLQSGYNWWQTLVLFVVALDVFGGAVANGTRSTNIWYASRPAALSYGFLAVHAIHPLLVAWLLPGGSWPLFWFIYLYMLAAGSLVVRLRRQPFHLPVALAALSAGFLLYTYLFALPLPLRWFGYIFFSKLIVGFAVDHYGASREAEK